MQGDVKKDLETNNGAALNCSGKDGSNVKPWVAFKDLISGEGPPLRVLFAAMILEFSCFAMIIPILPFFLIHELGMGPSEVGLLLSAASLAQLIGAWISGRVSDATGRYPVIVVVFAWAGIGLGLTAMTTSFVEIFLVRLAQGLSGGTSPLCDAYVLDVTCESTRSSFIGLVGAVKGSAFLLGPGTGAFLVHIGFARRTIFLIAGAGAFLSAVICLLFLDESLPKANRRPLFENCVQEGKASCHSSDFDSVNKGLACVWFTRFASAMGLGFLFATYAFLIKDNFGWGDIQFGIVLTIGAATGAVLQAAAFPHLAAQFGTSRVLCLGCLLGAVAYVVIPEPYVLVHILGILIFQVSGAFIEPSFPVLIGEYVREQYFGFANGGTTSFRALATILTPLIAGGLYEMSARHAYYSGAACFAVAALGSIPILFKSDEEQPLLAATVPVESLSKKV